MLPEGMRMKATRSQTEPKARNRPLILITSESSCQFLPALLPRAWFRRRLGNRLRGTKFYVLLLLLMLGVVLIGTWIAFQISS